MWIQPSRMLIRGPQILAWSGSVRPLLLLRESHLTAGWHPARELKERRSKGSWLSTETVPGSTQPSLSSDCGNPRPKVATFQNLTSKVDFSSRQPPPPRGSTSGKSKLASLPWKCAAVENLAHNPKAVTNRDCSADTACLQPCTRPWDIRLTSYSFTSKTLPTHPQSRLYYRPCFVRPLGSSTLKPWISNQFHCRPKPRGLSLHQTRAVHHQAAPHVADTCRDCLSPENENRCRLGLGPNLKLYYGDNGGTEAGQIEGKNQGKWAAVLVSLCSVQGEPAFLFTLRSSMLKGRHKGDVSFAGGKRDPSDRDVVATALREAREELGVSVNPEWVWGVLKPLRDESGMMVAPVLANLGAIEELSFKPNPAEVEEIFTLTVSHLCAPQNRGYTNFRTGGKYGHTLPVFRNGKHKVWGLTAVALDRSLKLIVPS